MCYTLSLVRTFNLNLKSPLPCGTHVKFLNNFHMESKPFSESRFKSVSSLVEANEVTSNKGNNITLQEWQGWGTTSPVPSMVTEVIEDLKLLEKDSDAQMDFGGNHGTPRGKLKVQEDKKHREKFNSIKDSEKKLQFFSARQIACRLLGRRDYLCQKCWLTSEDCMCSKVISSPLGNHIRLWVYMHPKDFLRQNNTGKLLWQVFGTQSATLCLFGIPELEETMWNDLSLSGRNNVWCLYPNKNAVPKSVEDAFTEDVLMDRAQAIWGEDLPCISLNTGASLMHKLRPQPSWDRTCTAAAAIGLLDELHHLPEFSHYGLDSGADAIGDALEALFEALANRRIRMGRSVSRKDKYYRNIC